MLTKDLVRFRVNRGKLLPSFIKTDDLANLMLAGQLLDIFRAGAGHTRGSMEEACDALVQVFPGEAIVGRGLVKLLFDRTQFTEPSDEDLPEFRERLFLASGRLIGETTYTAPEDYFQALESVMGQPVALLGERMFSDLPAEHAFEQFKDLGEEQLLHRYNTALVQWMLLHADTLHITLEQTRPERLRQLLKYLRFNQLFAQIEKSGSDECSLKVDGPLNLFDARGKYGMNLAQFFPALLQQPKWQLKTLVSPKGKPFVLELDDRCALKPTGKVYHAYIPPELSTFQKTLSERAPAWRVETETDILNLPGEIYCFPDFRLDHEKGHQVHVELFHPWHFSHFPARLAQLQGRKDPVLILGVAKRCLSKLGDGVAHSDYFQQWGFVFNDLPVVGQLLPILERICPTPSSRSKATKKSLS